ncbi:response regulator [Lachnospiraceae bacterium ASD3451]|uniref:response regulator n=1 Tax=Diplocloster agilis TaxID=2850323 RepID=UPI001D298347|nr:response regulator [Diplocloster agilis]MBU9745073.1 response regulator [Diplocloster agilis]
MLLRVVIADDEDKVCQLIYGLIDWEALGMEVAGIAHNGLEALEMVESLKPDLMITDIRMPGYDGLELIERSKAVSDTLEFIIISGYRHFEYAQHAIKYGVGDYLLKPIKKEELTHTLEQIAEKHKLRTERISKEERLKMRLQSDIDRLRANLFMEVMQKHDMESLTLEKVNEDYHYHFQEGCFQVVVVKYDCGVDEQYDSSIKVLEEKVVQIMNRLLGNECFDMEHFGLENSSYYLLNYDPAHKKQIRKQLKEVLDELSVQKSAFGYVEFTIGAGDAADRIGGIAESYENACRAAAERLVEGTGRLIDHVEIHDQKEHTDVLLSAFNKAMDQALEVLNKDAVLRTVSQLEESVGSISEINGVDIIAVVMEACNTYVMLVKKNQLPFSNAGIPEKFEKYALRCGKPDEIFRYLSDLISESMDSILKDKQEENIRPIRQAKQYIQQNYMKSITLDDVSSVAGFNATYFSSLFKKETGSNFVEYLSEIRMNRAKDLLKETNMSIAAVCEAVGYNDLKHFTKSFKKAAGIKPGEYRKLYS